MDHFSGRTYRIETSRIPEHIEQGLNEIMLQFPHRFGSGGDAMPLRFEKIPDETPGLTVEKRDDILVRYGQPTDAFRALGRLLGESADDRDDFAETPCLDTIGVMIDVSRNGVIRVDAMRALLRRFALMGLNTLMLYTEDTYEVPGEPFFGYLRGGYTQQEMRELDAYARQFGIEMFPCIQALGHMAQVLQWPAYAEHADTKDVLLADDEKTYALIEKMIVAASEPFQSNRIHVGMDEAHGIGSGQYKKIHGEKRPFDILNRHLDRVRQICDKHGLKSMIWSDMYFRIGSRKNDYYDQDSVIPDDVIKQIPKDVQLVYWDYYHSDKAFFSEWIDRHRSLGSDPIVAGGIWTWTRFWATLPFSFRIVDACMNASRDKAVREVFMTLWSDDGTECDIFSALPGLQYFAEHAYGQSVDPTRLRANFRGSCDADFDDWLRASDLDALPCLDDPHGSRGNPSKFLLWQDPLLSIMDSLVDDTDLTQHYEQLAQALEAASRKAGDAARLRFPALIASVLAIKTHLRRRLASAYAQGDRERLAQMVAEDLSTLRDRMEALWTHHRDLWMSLYKPFGWETLDRRYGGLLARLDTVSARLQAYLDGDIDTVPELEAKLERVFEPVDGEMPPVHAARVVSPSVIKI